MKTIFSKYKFLILLPPLVLLNLMCLFSAFEIDQDNFPKIKPEIEDLSGKYIPNKTSIQNIKVYGNYNIVDEISIYLNSDGTFEMNNMPDWWITEFNEPKGKFDKGNGQWEIINYKDWWSIELHFVPGGKFHSREGLSEGFYFSSVYIDGTEPPYSIVFYIGDLDKGNRLFFEKVSN